MNVDAALSVRDVSSGHGRIPVLSGVSLSVAAGEFVGILGHNGMGKTTLLRTLMGYLPVTSGSVRFGGVDLLGRSTTDRARAGIGYVPQGREIFASLNVYENLRTGCFVGERAEELAIEEVLAWFPRLKGYLHRPGGALSGGEQQLLALARCLCGSPKLLLLDEPTEGIQPSIIEEMAATLAMIGQSRRLAMLLVEQNLNFVASLSGRILILQKGVITREVSRDMALDPAMLQELSGMS